LYKNPLIFIGCIAAAVLITILVTGLIYSQSEQPNPGLTAGPDGSFYRPSGVAFSDQTSNQRIIVADTFNNRIQIFDPDRVHNNTFGTPGALDGQFYRPYGVATNGSTTEVPFIFVADTFNHRVQIFDILGNFLDKFGTPGQGDGEFYRPYDITVNASHIFVADAFNDRIQIFNLSGQFVQQINATSP